MSKKRHGDEWVSLSTGEVVAVQRGVRYPNGLAFMTIFQSGLQHLAKLDLTGRECRVLFALMAALDYENWVSISQQTIAEDIGLHQPAVASAIKRLCQEGSPSISFAFSAIYCGPNVYSCHIYGGSAEN